jgi:UDP-N-acetylglucosamine--N-acetylmuramyl-(pentapeptide) pyrophosphoryl-undecaprenol N-acetylglucosamine transferase
VNVVIAAGGTGGHIYPALAIADALRERFDANISFVGTSDRLETRLVPAAGYPLREVHARPMIASRERAVVNAVVNAWGVAETAGLLRGLRPHAVVATGGYVCFPVVAAAALLRRAGLSRAGIAMLEPNVTAGLTSRVTARWVDEIWGPYDTPDPRLRGKYIKIAVPVRSSLRRLPDRESAAREFGLDPARPIILSMGGSQGARTLNDALIAGIRAGSFGDWQAIVVAGDRGFDELRSAQSSSIAVRRYLDDPAPAFAAANLVLARGGASTLADLTAVRKPAMIVPYPFAASDEQTANAKAYAEAGSATVLTDREVREGGLTAALQSAMEPAELARATAAAERMPVEDPLADIVARVERLASRTTRP